MVELLIAKMTYMWEGTAKFFKNEIPKDERGYYL